MEAATQALTLIVREAQVVATTERVSIVRGAVVLGRRRIVKSGLAVRPMDFVRLPGEDAERRQMLSVKRLRPAPKRGHAQRTTECVAGGRLVIAQRREDACRRGVAHRLEERVPGDRPLNVQEALRAKVKGGVPTKKGVVY